mmetsp:Transcript_15346/g.23437  ORF Transcript_15346/g.23437 Transcript_15346/m.23437 type:complete len:93 (-) Transcript_15346:216-494(-)
MQFFCFLGAPPPLWVLHPLHSSPSLSAQHCSLFTVFSPPVVCIFTCSGGLQSNPQPPPPPHLELRQLSNSRPKSTSFVVLAEVEASLLHSLP